MGMAIGLSTFLYHLPITLPLPTALMANLYVWINTTVSTKTTHAGRDSNPGLALAPDQEDQRVYNLSESQTEQTSLAVNKYY